MSHNYWFWRHYVDGVVFPTLDMLKRFYEERISPAFADLVVEAEHIQAEAWDRMLNQPVGEDAGDLAGCAETAQEEALDWYVSMGALQHRVNGVFCVAIWSQIEQFLALLLTRELLPVGDSKEDKAWTFGCMCKEYSRAGIDIRQLRGFDSVDLLRLVNNACKHGQGWSRKRLREKEPRMVSGEDVTVEDSFVISAFAAAKQYIGQIIERLQEVES